MALAPLLAQLRRNRIGALLIGLQMALNLAILCNAAFIIQQRAAYTQVPSGVDEENVLVMHNEWLHDSNQAQARLETDLARLRQLPGVVDAFASNTYPMSDSGSTGVANLRAHQAQPTARAALYFADEHALATLGLQLIAGRNFTPEQVQSIDENGIPRVSAVIITRALAQKLFPRQNAVGRQIYLDNEGQRATIIGVVAALQVPWTHAGYWGSSFRESSMLWPVKPLGRNVEYIIRARPGELAHVMAAAQDALYAVNRDRILTQVRSLTDARWDAYRDDRGFVGMLTTICLLMMAVTAWGVVGLTSYWVTQRRRQIGIRRALGATRLGVVGHFQAENLAIALAGTVMGAATGVGLNLWAVQQLEAARLPPTYVIIGMAALILLGQLAALWPAARAAAVPPALAARSA